MRPIFIEIVFFFENLHTTSKKNSIYTQSDNNPGDKKILEIVDEDCGELLVRTKEPELFTRILDNNVYAIGTGKICVKK